jgi:uncharacterized membrane protein
MAERDTQRFWWRRALAPMHESRTNVGQVERVVSAAGGAVLLGAGLSRKLSVWPLLTALGALGLLRGATGHSRVYELAGVSSAPLEQGSGIGIDENVTISCSARELYDRWTDLRQLPRYLRYVKSVTETVPGVTHWMVEAPNGRMLEWDAEIIEKRPGELIAWHTVRCSAIEHTGSVHFREVPGRGTEMQLKLRFVPPGGAAGFALARLLQRLEARGIAEELRRFKSITEAGEAPTTEGQPSGRERMRRPVIATAPSTDGMGVSGYVREV